MKRFNFEQSMGFTISRTAARMKNHLGKTLKPFNITPEQWVLLVRLWHQDGISQKALANKTCKDQPTITRILDKLEQRGLITRKNNPEDRRAFLIFLTREGREIRQELEEAARKALDDALHGFTPGEQDQLKQFLNRITDNLT